ncbi:hypothetical protein HDU85_005200 [Gaertneriomyces sp. JEL0708]|nr:hypothetical protein HDU85_005200 [Gaertneriomyces sp. JEL0708]
MLGPKSPHALGVHRLQILLQWFEEHRVTFDATALEIRVDQEGAMAVYAKRNISEDEELCQIPKQAILSPRTTAISDLIELLPYHITSTFCVAVALLYERALGEKSVFWGYIQSLPPREEGCTLFWSDEELRWLSAAQRKQVLDDRRLIDDDWAAVVKLMDEHIDVFGQDLRERMKVEHFKECVSLVSSRAFTIDDYHGNAMVPLADLFNHSWKENVHFMTDGAVCEFCGVGEGCWCWEEEPDMEESDETPSGEVALHADDAAPEPPELYDPEEWIRDEDDMGDGDDEDDDIRPSDILSMTAFTPVKAGREIYNTYGSDSSRALLKRYGFVERASGHEEVSINEEELRQLASSMGQGGDEERWMFWNGVGRFCVDDVLNADDSDEEMEEDIDEDGGDGDDHGEDDGHDEDDHMHHDDHSEASEEEEAKPAPLALTAGGTPSPHLITLLHILTLSDQSFASYQSDPMSFLPYVQKLAEKQWNVQTKVRKVKVRGQMKLVKPSKTDLVISRVLKEIAKHKLDEMEKEVAEHGGWKGLESRLAAIETKDKSGILEETDRRIRNAIWCWIEERAVCERTQKEYP